MTLHVHVLSNSSLFKQLEPGHSLVDIWEEEFAEMTGNSETSDEEFWEKLQKHWEDVDK